MSAEEAAGATEPLFAFVERAPLVPLTPVRPLTAEDIKTALRRHHPGDTVGGMPGQWVTVAEWRNIDLLALNAWRKADVIGYEVKISRSDLRRELLRPHKRSDALEHTTEFYLAVPEGLLTADEIAYEEPEWQPEDFQRTRCPGIPPFGRPRATHLDPPYGGRCQRWHRIGARRPYTIDVPVPRVIAPGKHDRQWMGEADAIYTARLIRENTRAHEHVICWVCEGRGYTEKSRVERDAPTCWVPRDMGLVVVTQRGVRVVKPSPKRKDPKPIASSRQQLNTLVRWVSHRPDPRHR